MNPSPKLHRALPAFNSLVRCCCFLTIALYVARSCLAQSQAAENFPPHDGSYFIESRPAWSFKATLDDTWTTTAAMEKGQLKIFAPVPPNLDGQRDLIVALFGPTNHVAHRVLDRSPEHRAFEELDVDLPALPASHCIPLKLQYIGTLYSRHLIRRAPTTTASTLTKEERLIYTAVTPTLDFTNPAFVAWMRNQQLTRRAATEDATAFAWRVFSYFISHGKYGGNAGYDSLHASNTCKSLNTDCGGFSLLFTSVLRANNIPARCLFGRWSLPQTNDYGQYHVIAEFFAPKTGWVPVDIASTIVHHPKSQAAFFGNTDGQFLAFHLDPDLEPSKNFHHGWAQYLLLKWEGPGNFFDTAKVTSQWNVMRPRPETATGQPPFTH